MTSLASAEPRLDVSDLGQLLGRELALQSIDGLCQIFSMMPALDGIIGQALHARKRLVGLRAWSRAGNGSYAENPALCGVCPPRSR
jgi:hypothetical protein